MPGSPIWSASDGARSASRSRGDRAPSPAFPETPMARCFVNLGKRRRLPWRWRCTRADCSRGTNGPPRLPTKSSARKRQAILTRGETYYRHWLATLERLVSAKGVASLRYAASLPRRLGPRRRPHAAWFADPIEAGGFCGTWSEMTWSICQPGLTGSPAYSRHPFARKAQAGHSPHP